MIKILKMIYYVDHEGHWITCNALGLTVMGSTPLTALAKFGNALKRVNAKQVRMALNIPKSELILDKGYRKYGERR